MSKKNEDRKNKKKIDEKQLEQQMINMLSSQGNQGGSAGAIAISSFLLFRASKRLERYSIILLAAAILLASGFVALAVVLGYYAGLIP